MARAVQVNAYNSVREPDVYEEKTGRLFRTQ
jgi:hypothetical protein